VPKHRGCEGRGSVIEFGNDFLVRDSTGMHCACPEFVVALDVAYQQQIEIEADSPR
jgi:hypothetical protein